MGDKSCIFERFGIYFYLLVFGYGFILEMYWVLFNVFMGKNFCYGLVVIWYNIECVI